MNVEPEFLSVRETAKRLGVHENTVRNWAKDGQLPHDRKPGSSFYRFKLSDVERLARRKRRASPVEPARRLIGPELVDGSQLAQWADTRESQDRFPELLRRLLQSTSGCSSISMRAGDGVSAPGWDGSAVSEGSEHLPAGRLHFEIGVSKNVKAKADHDWAERRRNARGAMPHESIFVFVTPRRWGDRDKWEASRRAENYFKDVRVLDADDLEGWLQASPVVHHWISEHLHRRPRDAQTLETWWKKFQARTTPQLSHAIFLCGRERQQETLQGFLAGPPGVITVRAEWRDDAIAFISATMDDSTEGSFAPGLIVSSSEIWDHVAASNGRMTLISLVSEIDASLARNHGHHVIIPIGAEASAKGTVLSLPRPGRALTRDAFADLGLSLSRADHLAGLARRSMPAMIRMISRDSVFAHPPWSELPHAALLGPLALLGSWVPSNKADRQVIERLVRRSWDAVERDLLHLARVSDPPVIRSGDRWHFASQEEALMLLASSVTTADLSTWQLLVTSVFNSPFREPPELLSALRGDQAEHKQMESSVLRRGMASALAILGANGVEASIGGTSGDVHASHTIRLIYKAAQNDSEGLVWQGIADVLPLLAEAAPREFLDALHDDLARPKPLIANMFKDHGSRSLFGSPSPHTGLLFALESLCWSPDFIVEASMVMARLSKIDPGGTLVNRPIGSLKSILVDWVSHTSASTAQKIECISSICAEFPSFGWNLLLELWPEHHASSIPPASPEFRDWKPDSDVAQINDRLAQIDHIVGLAIDLAGQSAERWAELCERLGTLPSAEFRRILDRLQQLVESTVFPQSDRASLWDALRSELARNEQFAGADWALDEMKRAELRKLCATLEPVNDVRRFSYLFSRRPHIPGVNTYDEPSYSSALQNLQNDAIREVLNTSGFPGLLDLAGNCSDPGLLGWILGREAENLLPSSLTSELAACLDSDIQARRRFAGAWANRRLEDGGVRFLRELMSDPGMNRPARRAELAIQLPADPEVWSELQESEPEIMDHYWQSVNPWRIADGIPIAIQQLCGHSRPWAAVELIAARGLGQSDYHVAPVDADAVEAVLDEALASAPSEGDRSMLGYEVGRILDFLEWAGRPIQKLAQVEFSLFYLLDDHRPPRALFKLLADDARNYVELACHVYMPKSGSGGLLKDEQVKAHLSWSVLNAWKGVPGLRSDGAIDCDGLTNWVNEARLLLADADRDDIGDELVGQVLARSPVGVDGIWPAECVRDLVETIGSVSLETGLEAGAFNARGATTRGVYDGGDIEATLSARYRDWAQRSVVRWPRTTRVLRRLADTYENFGRREDTRATERADTP